MALSGSGDTGTRRRDGTKKSSCLRLWSVCLERSVCLFSISADDGHILLAINLPELGA